MKKSVVILGAGKSSAALIRYMLQYASECNWHITVADVSKEGAEQKIKGFPEAEALALNAGDSDQLEKIVSRSDLIISLLPAAMHQPVAEMCVRFGKNFISASFTDEKMNALDKDAVAAGVILMNEAGLDPGIDHMSAMQIIAKLKNENAEILSFESYTGGLVAPESDNNPWHYKFSWNPRNVVLAGQGTAKFLWKGELKYIPYNKLFSRYDVLNIPGYGEFEGYPNRDSLKYKNIYGLDNVSTLVRGTLRRRGYCDAWNVFVQLGLTDDSYILQDSENKTWRELVNSFLPESDESTENKLMQYLHIENRKDILERLEWLGIFSDLKIKKQKATPAQALQELLEEKWKLMPGDKDMCVMIHSCEYLLNNKKYLVQSSMVQEGEDEQFTAMSKTVGLPMAIISKMILNGEIKRRGVLLPVYSDIYEPVLKELRDDFAITFNEHGSVL